MNFSNRKILYLNLAEKSFEIKTYPDLHSYLGGLALGLKLVDLNRNKDPLVFSIGPLNGIYPFVSKTCILDYSKKDNEGFKEFYLGGSLSSRIKFTGFDAIVLLERSQEPIFLEVNPKEVNFISSTDSFFEIGLPGRSSKLAFKNKLLLDDYFYTSEDLLGKSFIDRNVGGMVFNATAALDMNNISHYEKTYHELLNRKDELMVVQGSNPSCIGCPMGCRHSQIGEVEGNVLVHSLVACQYAAELYSDLGVVFSCLNALGYDYRHEDLERIPSLVKNLMKDLNHL